MKDNYIEIEKPIKNECTDLAGRRIRIALSIIAYLLILLFVTVLTLLPLDGVDVAEAATLKQGSSGTAVRNVQTKLKSWGYYTGSVDGIYGAKTVAAVKYFQRKNGLTADGVVGSRTAAAMGISLSGSSTTSTTNTSSNLTLLSRLVYAEARGEPYTGQVAVAAVVLNRMKSSSFPNTMAGVIYQAGAFDCVSDGQINLSPNATAKKAAQDAINGWDPSYGCLYYYNPRTATSRWMLSRTVKLNIGNHAFC